LAASVGGLFQRLNHVFDQIAVRRRFQVAYGNARANGIFATHNRELMRLLRHLALRHRFARLSNGFSKKIDCHLAAVGLYVAFYDLCRTHEALRMTPAMALGITDRVWTISELIGGA